MENVQFSFDNLLTEIGSLHMVIKANRSENEVLKGAVEALKNEIARLNADKEVSSSRTT